VAAALGPLAAAGCDHGAADSHWCSPKKVKAGAGASPGALGRADLRLARDAAGVDAGMLGGSGGGAAGGASDCGAEFAGSSSSSSSSSGDSSTPSRSSSAGSNGADPFGGPDNNGLLLDEDDVVMSDSDCLVITPGATGRALPRGTSLGAAGPVSSPLVEAFGRAPRPHSAATRTTPATDEWASDAELSRLRRQQQILRTPQHLRQEHQHQQRQHQPYAPLHQRDAPCARSLGAEDRHGFRLLEAPSARTGSCTPPALITPRATVKTCRLSPAPALGHVQSPLSPLRAQGEGEAALPWSLRGRAQLSPRVDGVSPLREGMRHVALERH